MLRRRRHHHGQPVFHRRGGRQASQGLQREGRDHAGELRREGPRLRGGEWREGGLRRRRAAGICAILGTGVRRRERSAGGEDRRGRRGGTAVLLRHDGASEGGDADAQGARHRRGAASRRREPEFLCALRRRGALRSALFPYLLAIHFAVGFAGRVGDPDHAEV